MIVYKLNRSNPCTQRISEPSASHYTNGSTMTEKRLHPSLASHLDTDLQVLSAVIERSNFQHRSQPFLRRMREVLRLGRRVAVLVNEYSTASAIDASTDNQSNAVEREIVVKVRLNIGMKGIS